MRESQRLALEGLRAAGYAVCIFSPEELREANPRSVEERMSTEGFEAIEALVGEDPENEGAPCADPFRR